MTLDQLILGACEGDETVLSYLEKLSDRDREALFAPMFAVTRPTVSIRTDSRKTGSAEVAALKKANPKLSALEKKFTPEQMAALKDLMI